jgi:hypothetical protein
MYRTDGGVAVVRRDALVARPVTAAAAGVVVALCAVVAGSAAAVPGRLFGAGGQLQNEWNYFWVFWVFGFHTTAVTMVGPFALTYSLPWGVGLAAAGWLGRRGRVAALTTVVLSVLLVTAEFALRMPAVP